MRLQALALLLLLVLPFDSARAVEVVLGVDGETGYNSNLFYQSTDTTGDGSVRLGPVLGLRDATGQLTWGLRYRPSYQVFYTTRGIDSVYHAARGEISWKPSAATELFANDRFSVTPSFATTTQTNQEGLLAVSVPVLSNSPVTQNYAEAGLRHSFSPLWLGVISATSSIVDYQSSFNADSSATAAQVYVIYGLRPTDRIGTGLGATRQTIAQVGGGNSGSNYYQLFGIWEHDFSPTWTMSLNAGPALVQPDSPDLETTQFGAPLYARNVLTRNGTVVSPLSFGGCTAFQGVLVAEGCPNLNVAGAPLDATQTVAIDNAGNLVDLAQTGTLTQVGPAPKAAGSSLTYFANLSVTKRWRWFDFTAAYVRNATNTSGFNQSLVTDTLSLTSYWDPSPRWRLTVSGIVQRRQSDSDQVFLLTPVSAFAVPLAFNPEIGVFSFTGARAQGLQAFTAKSGLKVMNYGITAELDRKLTRSSYVFGRASWDKQTTDRTEIGRTDLDRYIVTIGFRYEFEPIHVLN
ncbi:MAG: hypothetical protein IT386_17795 [Deltaproteobacteria bacterium]|nr:hypothetical protein [Deltaproteobacteria bacterium]